MKISNLNIVVATAVCAMLLVGMLASSAPWLARESIFEFTSRDPKKRNPADDASKGGPAERLGNSGATEGSPSVS